MTKKNGQEKTSEQLNQADQTEVTNLLLGLDFEFIEKVDAFTLENLGNSNFTADQLAHKVLMGRTQFFRKIKKLTNQTPNEYVRNFRLDQALERFKGVQKNINIIALEVGFQDGKYFSLRFKKRFGHLPNG